MDDSEQVNSFSRYAKDASIISKEQVAVTGPQYFVFWNERAPFREGFQ